MRFIRYPGPRATGYFFLLSILFILIANLIPLQSPASWSQISAELKAGLTLTGRQNVLISLAQRLPVFFALGVLSYWTFVRRGRRRPRLSAGATVVLVAFTIELCQAIFSTRHAALTDFLLASVSALSGVLISDYRGQVSSTIRSTLLRILIAGNIIVSGLLVLAHYSVDLAGWDCAYPLLLANEATQDRPWRGDIRGVALYPRALDETLIRKLSQVPMTAREAGQRTQAGGRLIYLFDQPGQNIIRQQADRGPDVGLLIGDIGFGLPVIENGSLRIERPAMIRSSGSVSAICRTILQTGAFTIEVEFAAADNEQTGPARIVTLSSDPDRRNFTLAQQNNDLVWRVRTPWNGPNGALYPLQTTTGAAAGDWQRVFAGYTAGEAWLMIADRDQSRLSKLSYYTMLSYGSGWLSLAMVSAPLFFLKAVIAAYLFQHRSIPHRMIVLMTTTAAFPLITAVLLSVVLQHEIDWSWIAVMFVGLATGMMSQRVLKRLAGLYSGK
jgi:hypothetical protein